MSLRTTRPSPGKGSSSHIPTTVSPNCNSSGWDRRQTGFPLTRTRPRQQGLRVQFSGDRTKARPRALSRIAAPGRNTKPAGDMGRTTRSSVATYRDPAISWTEARASGRSSPSTSAQNRILYRSATPFSCPPDHYPPCLRAPVSMNRAPIAFDFLELVVACALLDSGHQTAPGAAPSCFHSLCSSKAS